MSVAVAPAVTLPPPASTPLAISPLSQLRLVMSELDASIEGRLSSVIVREGAAARSRRASSSSPSFIKNAIRIN
jgi:hypothetical protein